MRPCGKETEERNKVMEENKKKRRRKRGKDALAYCQLISCSGVGAMWSS
jgi:CRISPR/Cas system-associated protein Cas7 (RAMP superfamily)